MHAVAEFAAAGADVAHTHFPGHEEWGSSGRRESVGDRVEDKMILAAQRFDVMLNQDGAADNFDIDRHALAVSRGSVAGGDVRRRTTLVLMLRERKAPSRKIDLVERRIDRRGESGVEELVV